MKLTWRRPSLGTIGWILLLGFVGYRLWPELAAAVGVPAGSQRAPELRLETLTGDSIRPESLRGRVVLVNFWATWCPPCRVEMPGFESVWRSRAGRGFTIVGLVDDAASSSAIRAFLRKHRITYPVARSDAELMRGFGSPNVLPTSFLIDRSGRIRYTVRGIFAQPALALAVDRLLKESAPRAGRSAGPQGEAGVSEARAVAARGAPRFGGEEARR